MNRQPSEPLFIPLEFPKPHLYQPKITKEEYQKWLQGHPDAHEFTRMMMKEACKGPVYTRMDPQCYRMAIPFTEFIFPHKQIDIKFTPLKDLIK